MVKIDRREFLTGAALLGLSTLLPAGVGATGALGERAQAFRAALGEKLWLLAWQSATATEFAAGPDEIALEGRIPEALAGSLIRNGPAGHEVFGRRYRHWFDGDGLVHRFRIADGQVRHDGRMIETPKWQAEHEARRPLFQAFDTPPPAPRAVRSPDEINVANINVIDHGGRLQALWEGGSAAELDRETLAFKAFVTMSPETRSMPVTAHPRLDADGTLWSFGYAGYAGKLLIYRIGADGALKAVQAIDVRPTPMVHDFMITERHLVFILAPWVYEQDAGETFLERHVWRPEWGGRALIVEKDDLARRREVELPPYWVYHFANAWADDAGRIHFDFPRYPDPSATTEAFRQVMAGEHPTGSFATYHSAVLDPMAGTYDETVLIDGPAAEFPRVHPGRIGRRHRRSLVLLADGEAKAGHPFFTTTAMLDLDSGKVDGFVHGPNELAEEAVYVPLDESERGGFVLQTTLDFAAGRTRLKIFEAGDIAVGPVAVATLPYALPLGLHGSFVTA